MFCFGWGELREDCMLATWHLSSRPSSFGLAEAASAKWISLAAFFSRNGLIIEELQTSTYPAPHTGTPMFSVVMTVGIPADVHIATLRGDFLDYCDELNLDATFEPVRG